MEVSYDMFTAAFLAKITEYNFIKLSDANRQTMIDRFMKEACADFSFVCLYDIGNGDDETRTFNFEKDGVDITPNDLHEIVSIVSDGMVYYWLRQYMYAAENLQNNLNTQDFTSYSPSELLYRMTNAYHQCERDFVNRIREYSFRHGDLTDLHI